MNGKYKVHLLNGGGIVPTGTLNREVIILSEIDYNIKSMGVL